MPTIEEVRSKFPQYGDMSDGQLADALHTKFYSDMPRDEFNQKIGLEPPKERSVSNMVGNLADQALRGVPVLGPLIGKGQDALQAGLEGRSYSDVNAESEKRAKEFSTQYPKSSIAANIGGGLATTAPLGAIAPVAKAMGMGGGPLLANIGRGTVFGAGLGATDSAVRGNDPIEGAISGGAFGGASPVIGKALGPVFGSAGKSASAPTADELKAAAKGGYDSARNAKIEFKPEALTDFSVKVKTDLNTDGINEILAPKTFGLLDKLGTAPQGATVTVDNFRTLQRSLGRAAASPDATERMAATRALQSLNGHLENIPASNILKGTAADAAEVSNTIKTANANYAASKRSDLIQGKVDRAELNASTANSGQNLDNSLRQQVKSILTNPKALRGFNAEEKAQMMKVASGTAPGNIIRHVGNLLGGGGGLGALTTGAAATYAAGGPIGMAAPLAGWALKKAGNALTANNIAKLDELVRSRSPLAQQQFSKALQQAGGNKSAALQTLMSAAFLQDPTGKLNKTIAGMFKQLPPSGAVPAGAESNQ